MLEGWLAGGLLPSAVTVVDPAPTERLLSLSAQGLVLNPPEAGTRAAEVVVLAIKPQTLDAAAGRLARAVGPDTLLISVLAGKRISDLVARAPQAKAIVRAMPNTPAAVGRGITGCAASPGTTADQRALTTTLLESVGLVEWLDSEDLIDAVTALSGGGPAYVFHMVEAMASAGVAAGLPADVSLRLARRTVEGAGELLFREQETAPETLRRNVTSPGGTTAEALRIMMAEGGLTDLMTRAVAAAQLRAGELSG
ncbi:MAG: pyrroline-5-carboxylate reductase [Beijerinckiaceae bacterium]